MASTTTCPETVDLYDHLEGALSLDAHLAECARCRESLESLRTALSAESAAFAPPSELEVERALQNVRARGRARVRRPWGQTALAFAAASVTLALLLPSAFESPDPCRPIGNTGPGGFMVKTGSNVDAPAGSFIGDAPKGTFADVVELASSSASVDSGMRSNR